MKQLDFEKIENKIIEIVKREVEYAIVQYESKMQAEQIKIMMEMNHRNFLARRYHDSVNFTKASGGN